MRRSINKQYGRPGVQRHGLLLALPAAFLMAASVAGASPGLNQELLADVDYAKQPRPEWIVSGPPEPFEMVFVARAGARHVVNLLGVGEFDAWDHGALARALELEYYHIPIADGDDLDREAVAEFDRVIEAIGDDPALIFCGSGNRVGAAFALRAAWHQGYDVEEAIAIGREHGLTRLESRVRALLDDS